MEKWTRKGNPLTSKLNHKRFIGLDIPYRLEQDIWREGFHNDSIYFRQMNIFIWSLLKGIPNEIK